MSKFGHFGGPKPPKTWGLGGFWPFLALFKAEFYKCLATPQKLSFCGYLPRAHLVRVPKP